MTDNELDALKAMAKKFRPPTFAPGDRVHVRLATATRRNTTRIARVTYAEPDAVRIELADGVGLVVGPDALTLLPPAKTRGPGAGRPTTTGRVRVGNVINVYRTGAGGDALLLSGTVEAVEDTEDGLRVELAGEGGSGMVVVR